MAILAMRRIDGPQVIILCVGSRLGSLEIRKRNGRPSSSCIISLRSILLLYDTEWRERTCKRDRFVWERDRFVWEGLLVRLLVLNVTHTIPEYYFVAYKFLNIPRSTM